MTVGLVTHTDDDFEEPFSMPCTYKTRPAIHILMLVATWPPRTIVKRDPKCMTRENLTGSVGERAFSAAQLGIVTCKCNRGRIIDQDKNGAQRRQRKELGGNDL